MYVDPDDLVQDLFEKLIKMSALPDATNERAWLARVMHNLFIDKLRRATARREDPIEEAEAPVLATDDAPWWNALDEGNVRAAVDKLPLEQRATFEKFAFEGKSYDTIAAELGIAKATVGTRILRARQKLRDLLVATHGGAE